MAVEFCGFFGHMPADPNPMPMIRLFKRSPR